MRHYFAANALNASAASTADEGRSSCALLGEGTFGVRQRVLINCRVAPASQYILRRNQVV